MIFTFEGVILALLEIWLVRRRWRLTLKHVFSHARLFSLTSRGLLCTKRLCLRVHGSFFEVYTADEMVAV